MHGYFLVEVESGIVLQEGHSLGGSVITGVPEIDALNHQFMVQEVGRVHLDPPRGHRDPALFRQLGLDRIYYFVVDHPRLDIDQVALAFHDLDQVQFAWVDTVVQAEKTPNDPLWVNQWNLSSAEDLDCPPAWDVTTASTVLVSVVDSGGQLDHADLDANIWVNPGEIANNGRDDDGNGYVDDIHGWDFWSGDSNPYDEFGHGTHVSGIIGAEGDNGLDVAGICWTARIQEVKVLDGAGAGTFTSIARGIVYAAENGADVSNYSIGGVGGDPGLEAAVLYTAGLDIVQVAAAGNSANTVPFYPAAYSDVIAVMASDASEKRTLWSNWGAWCDLCAPGDAIYSLWKGDQFNVLSGTSMASPHVAAIAALSRSLNPQLDRLDVELCIRYGAKDLGNLGEDSSYEWGLADLNQSLYKAVSLSLSTTVASIGDSVDVHVQRSDTPGDIFFIAPSISGREPGEYLGNDFVGETRILPINPDLTTFLAAFFPTIGVFNNFSGLLDASGKGTGTLRIPGGPFFKDETVSFSGLTFNPADLSKPRYVLGSITLKVQ